MSACSSTREVVVGEHIRTTQRRHKIKRSEYLVTGSIPVVDQSQEFIAGYIDDEERAYEGPLPVIVFGDHTCTLKYVDFPFAVGADGTQLIQPTEDFDIRYLYYSLHNLGLEHFGYQRHFKYLKEKRIPWHPLEEQRKIAAILSTYDDLIENNTRRIRILEEMAQIIYREWFVNLRFPGHENVKMVESELGMIPEWWEVGTLNELARIVSGFAFSSKEYLVNGKYSIVTIRNIQDGVFMPDCNSRVDRVPPNMPEHCRLHTGDILLSLTGNVGRTCLFYGEQHLLNQRVAKILPREGIGESFVYFTFRQDSLRRRLEMISTGVAQQNLSPINAGNLELILPPKQLLTDFCRTFDVFVEHILLLSLHTANLQRTRDLLLPTLISGEIDVENLDIDTGEAQA